MSDPWGFCQYCAFEVPVDDGVLVEHRRNTNGIVPVVCCGSHTPPTGQGAPEVRPIPGGKLTVPLKPAVEVKGDAAEAD